MKLTPGAIIILYILISAAGIVVSDQVVDSLIPSNFLKNVFIQSIKGLLYVSITSIILYLLLNRLEEQHKLDSAVLKSSEERWYFALDGGGNGVWDWNMSTGEVFYSKQWKRMLGYTDNDIINTYDEWEKRVHLDDKNSTLAAIKNHIDGKTLSYINEHRIQCKDGSYKWILARGKIIAWTHDGKPLRIIGTHTDITERKKAEHELAHLAITDYLTGVHNRRYFMERAKEEFRRCTRYGEKLSVIMIDLDWFKNINDTYGHDIGDKVLVSVARRTQELLRNTDVFGRMGGEEFGVILIHAAEAHGLRTAERLRHAYETLEVDTPTGKARVTGSFGLASLKPEDVSFEDILKRADNALYEAKHAGRNRVMTA